MNFLNLLVALLTSDMVVGGKKRSSGKTGQTSPATDLAPPLPLPESQIGGNISHFYHGLFFPWCKKTKEMEQADIHDCGKATVGGVFVG